MLIQCQHCHTTYKIDEQKIPNKDSFVRCAKCSELISLNREKQQELQKSSSRIIVNCGNCGTQYSVPSDSIKGESAKVRCGKCGHNFTVSKPDSLQGRQIEDEEEDINLDNISIPSESEIEVDNLFGDMETPESPEDEGSGIDIDESESLTGKDATDEYLESVSLDSDDLDDETEDLGMSKISDEQKYKIFLKPKQTGEAKEISDDDQSWPDIEDETEESEEEKELEIDEFTDLEGIGDLPDSGKKEQKPKKEKKPKEKKKKRVFLWLIWLLIIAAAAVAAWLFLDLRTEDIYAPPQTETFDSQSKVTILEPLKGKTIKNQNYDSKLFVLEGKLINTYPGNVKVSNIQIEGYLYTQTSDEPVTATSVAGTALSEDRLERWTREQIESSLQAGLNDPDAAAEFGPEELIDFQVVFFNPPDQSKVNKLGATIKKFNRRVQQ